MNERNWRDDIEDILKNKQPSDEQVVAILNELRPYFKESLEIPPPNDWEAIRTLLEEGVEELPFDPLLVYAFWVGVAYEKMRQDKATGKSQDIGD